MELVTFSLILVIFVAVLSVIATIVSVISHARANKGWGLQMADAKLLLGRVQAGGRLADLLLRESRSQETDLGRNERGDPTSDAIKSDLLSSIKEVERFMASLDDMPILSLAMVEDHADHISELADGVGELRRLLNRFGPVDPPGSPPEYFQW